MKFNLWVEQKEIEDAILGIVGNDLNLSPEEKNHLLQRNTKEFSSEIHNKIKNLGVVKKTNNNQGKYGDIVNGIKKGIKIIDLINAVKENQ